MPEAMAAPRAQSGGKNNGGTYVDRDKPAQIRYSNISAAKAVADAVRTSLGPKGMDKMIQDEKGDVTITNDGATILKQMQVLHPSAKMLVELSKAQDIEAGDGTTSVVIIAGALLDACSKLLQKGKAMMQGIKVDSLLSHASGIHPTIISESFQKAVDKGVEVLTGMSRPVELSDRESLLNSATTSLCSKVVSQYSSLLAPMSVDAVMRVIDPATATGVDLNDIKIIKKLGGTIDDCELVEGLVLTQRVANTGVTRVEKAKIGLIQFCLSPPKTDMDNQIVVSDYAQMDRVLREERSYILNLVKQIKKAGCNVLLIQKSILRDALSDLALHFLNKMKIMVVKEIEREDIEFICKASTIGTKPIAHIDHFTPEMLGTAELAEEVNLDGSGKLVKITGCSSPGKTVSIVVRGSNKLVIDEAERSIHDALCVIRCLVKKKALIAGGGAPEIELAVRLTEYSRTLGGMEAYCVRAYGDALEVIPSTLAENAGLNPISTVTELRNRHAQGDKMAGINVRKGGISNILEELVVQPLLVSISALTLATETVRSILKIDDVTPVDPHTKAPLASYERGRVPLHAAAGQVDNRDYENELEYGDSGSDFCDEDCLEMGGAHMGGNFRAAVDRLDLSEIFFSNEEYYSKLEELKRAHERTMAELESMYQQKLQLRSTEAFDMKALDIGHRVQWTNMSPAAPRPCLRKSHSAGELRRGSGLSDSSEEEDAANSVEKGLLFSPKEHIKNMWKDFQVSSYNHQLSSSLQSLPGRQKKTPKRRKSRRQDKHKVTVPKPFHMTLREAQRRKLGIKTRSEIELENMELRRQLEEVTECQRKFRASPVPAHVHLPLYEELQERNEERRRTLQEREEKHLRTIQKPFSFIERERLKKEQKQQHPSEQEKVKPFKAKPVPKSVYAAASGEHLKEEQLYRSIKIQMRAQEMLQSSSMPPSMLTRRLSDRKKNKDRLHSRRSRRRFQKHLEKRKEVKPTTTCEPFELRTSQISSHKERIMADIEKEQSSPRMQRWPYVSSGAARTPNSSLCSSLSGSLELLPAKVTDATKRRHEAVSRKALEQRKKAEEEEERWKEKQRQRERKLQREVLKRAQANDPHTALSQTNQSKLKEFRKQDLQRKKEYKQEIKEMQQRVKGRPLLLEQVAQVIEF
ncbi:T-complex protein 1 subunit delta [Oryzias melastigma]|uniref:T-complex protein 1 subunit delta n=1 Tax=Oryzias melastigma TaxID=30732 RepID=A0A834CBA5_ORYME|nr:T-complex protein 1 subunit delta [Oryzias melastigma]